MIRSEGFADVTGGKVWYRISGDGGSPPLVAVHGGPGLTHDYFEPLEALGSERPVVFYDQLGGGKSDRPDDTSLWTLERFVAELSELVAALEIDRFHLYGHSWGSTLALEYALGDPAGLISLTLASPVISATRWMADAKRLLKAMPVDVRETLRTHEEAGTTASDEYQAAQMQYYLRHLIRASDPTELPEPLMRSIAGHSEAIYEYMWGVNEFNLTGTLAGLERADRLGDLTVPVLFTCGRYDEATPESAAYFQSQAPGSRLRVFENSAHLAFLEEPAAYVAAIADFLADSENDEGPPG